MSEPETDPQPKRRFRFPVSRQRLVEFTVVVLGVLVALGLENLIQEARFRGDARDLEKAFVGDLTSAVYLSLERQAVTPCLVQRLRVLSEQADAATDGWEPAEPVNSSDWNFATPQIYRSPTRVWATTTFDRALGSEAFKRIPVDRAYDYASIFTLIRVQQQLNDVEFLASMGLAPLAYSQPDMTAEVRADALQQIANLDRHQSLIALASNQIVEAVLALPSIGEEVRRLMAGAYDSAEAYEAYRSKMRTSYGDCVDFTAMNRLVAPAAS